MDIFTLILWIVTGAAFIISLIKDKKKTLKSFIIAKNMMKSFIGQIIGVLFLIGLIMTFIPPRLIKAVLVQTNIYLSAVISSVIGSITLIPAFVAFPLAGSFVDMGIGVITTAAFITTLTMVGVVTFTIEKQQFGLKFAATRNFVSFIFSIIIALLIGVIL